MILISLLCLNQHFVRAQCYSIYDLLSLGHHTNNAQISSIEKQINEFDNKLFKIQVLPQIQMSATLPCLTNSISPIVISDGSEKFVNRFYMTSALSLGVSQLVPFTGGTLSLTSELVRLDNFAPQRTKSYNLNIFNLSYSQSISSFNPYKWEKKSIYKQNEIFSKSQLQKVENNNLMIVELFFDLLIAQKREELNTILAENAKLIHEKAKALFSQGRMSQVDYMDTVLGLLQFRNSTAHLETIKHQNNLISKLKLENVSPTVYFNYDDIDDITISFDIDEVLDRVVRYSIQHEHELDKIEEDMEIQKIKSSRLPSISISLGGGYNSHNEDFRKLSISPSRNFSAIVSVEIPILTWGENRILLKRAEESIKISELNYRNNIDDLVSSSRYELTSLPLLLESIIISKTTLTVLYSQLHELTSQYDAGRISYTRIHDLQSEIIQEELSRLLNIKKLYTIQYKYRAMSLYDVLHNIYLY